MATAEMSEIRALRERMREDAGATTATRDALARSWRGKTVHALGTVEDVLGDEEEMTVLLGIEGEILTCPMLRVRGRDMEDANVEVVSWRKGDRVEVTGKLVWPSFEAELGIEILKARKQDLGI